MKRLFLVLMLLFGCLALPVCRAQDSETGDAFAFSLQTVNGGNGEEMTLASFTGKILILDFWAVYCPPCREEIPGFIEILGKYREKGVEIAGITLDKDPEKVKKFIADTGINYPILMSTKEVIAGYGDIRAIPTTFIISREGKVLKKHVGFVEKAVFEKELDEILLASPPPKTEPAAPKVETTTNATPAAVPASGVVPPGGN